MDLTNNKHGGGDAESAKASLSLSTSYPSHTDTPLFIFHTSYSSFFSLFKLYSIHLLLGLIALMAPAPYHFLAPLPQTKNLPKHFVCFSLSSSSHLSVCLSVFLSPCPPHHTPLSQPLACVVRPNQASRKTTSCPGPADTWMCTLAPGQIGKCTDPTFIRLYIFQGEERGEGYQERRFKRAVDGGGILYSDYLLCVCMYICMYVCMYGCTD